MTIHIPVSIAISGGPAMFVHNLAAPLAARGHRITRRASAPFDTLFIIAECPLTLALFAKLTRKRIVQRLDGVYHAGLPGLNRYLYPVRNLRMQLIHNFLADHIVYQSKFSQHMCQRLLGRPHAVTSVIYNGVERTSSPPAIPRRGEAKRNLLKLVTAAAFRRRDQIRPLLDALKHVKRDHELHIYGPHTPSLRRTFASLAAEPRIHYHGQVSHRELRELLPNFDIFLFSDQSACPNVVLEAQAAALPVVAFRRGSLPELIVAGETGELVDLPQHDPLRDSYPFNDRGPRDFAQAIERVTVALPRYHLAAWQRARHLYDITETARRYENVLRPG